MVFNQTPLRGSYLIELEKRTDNRGFFARYFCEKEFGTFGLNTRWVQINDSLSKTKGTLRGLHFQYPPNAEVKLIRCIKGAVWDVIVDIRRNSPTYGGWFGHELNEDNRTMMYVPQGFAHGFISLTENSELVYLVSSFYAPEHECTLKWDDTDLNISWPVKPEFISEKDALGLPLKIIKPVQLYP